MNSSKHYDLISKASVENIAKAALDFIHKDNKVAISGGTTYLDIFPFWIQALKGQNVEFFPVDERVVPFDHPDSNWGMANQHLFDRIEDTVSKQNFAVSIKQYENLLFSKFNSKLPVFDAVFLGVGTDGHTASLFPNTTHLEDSTSVVLATKSPKPPADRITLGSRILSMAKTMVVIITGSDKKPILRRILDDEEGLPIVKILKQRKKSTIIVQKGLL